MSPPKESENQLDPSRRKVDKKLTHGVLPSGSNLYKKFINNWREELSDNIKIGDVHVLPTPPDDEQLSRFIHVKYICYNSKGDKHKCVAKFKRQDLYFVGVRNGPGKQWFSLGGSEVDIGKSKRLGFANVTHGILLGSSGYKSLDEVVTDQNELVKAIMFFSKLEKDSDMKALEKEIARYCLVLIIMYCEAARSNSIRDHMVETWNGRPKYMIHAHAPENWKASIINNWMKMSRIFLERYDHVDAYEPSMMNNLNARLAEHKISNHMGPINTVDQLDRELGIVKREKGPIPKTKKGSKYGGESSSKGKGKEIK